MDDLNIATAPDDGTTELETDEQPQTGPAAPEDDPGQDVQDNQDEGTTDEPEEQSDVEEKSRQYYQSQYQKMKEHFNLLQQHFGGNLPQPGEQFSQKPQTQQQQMQLLQQQADEYGYDLGTYEGQQAFMDAIINSASGRVEETVQSVFQKQAEEAQRKAHMDYATSALLDWGKQHGVENQALADAWKDIASKLPPDSSPSVIAEFTMQSIAVNSLMDRAKSYTAKAAADAATKAKKLEGVKQPSPGSAPSPKTQTTDLSKRLAEGAKKLQNKDIDALFKV